MVCLAGQTAVITGASRGIGRAAALLLAREGANIVIGGTNADALQTLAIKISELGRQAVPCPGDVSDPEVAQQAVRLAESRFGKIDILVNNAGINLRGPTLQMDLGDWQRVMDINLNGTLHFCRAVLPAMIARNSGTIVNVSSATSKTPHRNAAPAYGASKAAVNYLTMHLAQEMAPHGIRVNAVCPGPIASDMTEQWSDAYRAQVTARVPLGRIGTPEEIARTILFLASDASGFVTGATLNANGGTLMG